MNSNLIAKIEAAFAGVPPGQIGLRQASAIDSRYNPGDLYDNPELYRSACDADALETDWKQIPFVDLARDPAIFSHLDDRGFKFVLPAMMRWSLSDGFEDEWLVEKVAEYRGGRMNPWEEECMTEWMGLVS